VNSADTTAIIPTSPIPSHPDTTLIDEVVANFRFHFPDGPVVIMADGVWNGVKHRAEQYSEYLTRLKNRYSNTKIITWPIHRSQSFMTRWVLEGYTVNTPYILFNEHDIPLRTDIKIDWDTIFELLRVGRTDVIRLSGFGEGIHPAHAHLAHGFEYYNNSTFCKTRQWSQWPHISSKNFYLQMLAKHFDSQEIKMIEERMHGVCQTHLGSWIRLWMYLPEGKDKRCFTHKEGRHGDPCHWENA
jgi:hypothetical protein